MMPIISGAQMHISHVRVDLRRGDIAVAEERLNRTRVSPVLQKVRSEAVTQRVW